MRIDNPKVELLLRNKERFTQKKVLIAGDIDSPAILHLVKDMASCTVLTDNFAYASQIASALNLTQDSSSISSLLSYKHLNLCFAGADIFASQLKDVEFDCVILFLSKVKDYCRKILVSAQHLFARDTQIFIVGENVSGGKSCDKIIATTNAVYKTDSARKCTLFETVYKEPFTKTYKEDILNLSINDQNLKLRQDVNVFSHGSLDDGTALLLSTVDTNELYGSVHDIGCGCGVIGIYAALKNPSLTVTLSDISASALECAAFNASENLVSDRIDIRPYCLGDSFEPCDFILSNPPFHDGIKNSSEKTAAALTSMRSMLKTGGSAIIVYNSFLDYKNILKNSFSKVVTLKSNTRFCVVQAFV